MPQASITMVAGLRRPRKRANWAPERRGLWETWPIFSDTATSRTDFATSTAMVVGFMKDSSFQVVCAPGDFGTTLPTKSREESIPSLEADGVRHARGTAQLTGARTPQLNHALAALKGLVAWGNSENRFDRWSTGDGGRGRGSFLYPCTSFLLAARRRHSGGCPGAHG